MVFDVTRLNPIALRKTKIVNNFGLSDCNRVKHLQFWPLNSECNRVKDVRVLGLNFRFCFSEYNKCFLFLVKFYLVLFA